MLTHSGLIEELVWCEGEGGEGCLSPGSLGAWQIVLGQCRPSTRHTDHLRQDFPFQHLCP
jgi:hypothetical protein